MLPSVVAQSTVKPLVYRPSVNTPQTKVNLSLIQNRVTVNILIPSAQVEGNSFWITGGISAQPGIRDGVMFSVIQEIIAWIDEHLDQELSVEKISGRSGYSVWHFQRKFLQLTGLNIYEYVRIRRVINASLALICSKNRILEIAIENGFNCQASFTRTVREVTGFTPAKIRREFTDDNQAWIMIIQKLIRP
ncbi:MAG: AraC family transcriptional regulator [Pantoea sp.]|uniref:helix-turn-helix domain-containing protein n=1 Tax=Pantoea sp. TaxID=69393 RepID=UPI0023952AD9|nr:AraC family transcriptional regulator [Pantoea sp.]MDE1190010.1 AraC family transcriptional regulator [Pantoea sp.]